MLQALAHSALAGMISRQFAVSLYVDLLSFSSSALGKTFKVRTIMQLHILAMIRGKEL